MRWSLTCNDVAFWLSIFNKLQPVIPFSDVLLDFRYDENAAGTFVFVIKQSNAIVQQCRSRAIQSIDVNKRSDEN